MQEPSRPVARPQTELQKALRRASRAETFDKRYGNKSSSWGGGRHESDRATARRRRQAEAARRAEEEKRSRLAGAAVAAPVSSIAALAEAQDAIESGRRADDGRDEAYPAGRHAY